MNRKKQPNVELAISGSRAEFVWPPTNADPQGIKTCFDDLQARLAAPFRGLCDH